MSIEGRGREVTHVTADVIVLGCSLPGIVAAHKLRKKFGDSMEIVVLDLGQRRQASRCNVTFQASDDDDEQFTLTEEQKDRLSRTQIGKYACEFDIPLPLVIISPQVTASSNTLLKLFQYHDGTTVVCSNDYHNFSYLNFFERFELNQYQNLLDESMVKLFNCKDASAESARKKLLYYDQTTMEDHICSCLLFSNSRELMRMAVRLVCGAAPSAVSLLFYLHQLRRTHSVRNSLDGDNYMHREKLLGYCRKRIASKLLASISEIVVVAMDIKEIRSYSDQKVILETMKGDTNYVCNLVAMALRPEQLSGINVDARLLTSRAQVNIARAMTKGRAKKFQIQYEDFFWRDLGYSGDIFSVKGPIIWAIERPKLSSTDCVEKSAGLVGYLRVKESVYDATWDSKEAVIDQLVHLFGPKAANPTRYSERDIMDVYIPKCGDYVSLSDMMNEHNPRFLEWAAFDAYAEGDVMASLDAGNRAYVHLMRVLRPQAAAFDDVSALQDHTGICTGPFGTWPYRLNCVLAVQVTVLTAAVIVGVKIARTYLNR